jgi:hypothetical protein
MEEVVKAFYSTGNLLAALVFRSKTGGVYLLSMAVAPLVGSAHCLYVVSPCLGHLNVTESSNCPVAGVGYF